MTATTLQLQRAAVVLSLATLITAQGPPSGFGGFGGSSNDDDSSSSSSSSDSNSNFDSSSFGSSSNNGGSNRGFGGGRFGDAQIMITAHAVLATLAFGFLFPVGGIMIRLGSFPGLWIVHGLFQIFAFLLYTAAFGIGVWMTRNFYTLNDAHPIIGIVVFALLVFQPLLGFLHHVFFKRYNARTIWSYGHIWFGRAVIILGIVNGGLGLGLAKRTGVMAPSNGAVIGYSVGAGVMGLAYLLSAWYGERKRSRSRTAAARANVPVKDGEGSSRNSSPRDAPRREYYKTERGYVRRASHSRHSGQRRMSRGQGYA